MILTIHISKEYISFDNSGSVSLTASGHPTVIAFKIIFDRYTSTSSGRRKPHFTVAMKDELQYVSELGMHTGQLPRQRDYVSGQKMCAYCIIFVVAIPFRHRRTLFVVLLVIEALTLCRVVDVKKLNIVACPTLLCTIISKCNISRNLLFYSILFPCSVKVWSRSLPNGVHLQLLSYIFTIHMNINTDIIPQPRQHAFQMGPLHGGSNSPFRQPRPWCNHVYHIRRIYIQKKR